jgi:hypothetical protein
MQRGYARGMSQAEARGHPLSEQGLTESQLRRLRFEERYGVPYKDWERFRRLYIKFINSRTWPDGPGGNERSEPNDPRVFPSDLGAIKRNFDEGFRDPRFPDVSDWKVWTEIRLSERVDAIIAYQDYGDATPGHQQYDSRSGSWTSVVSVIALGSAPPLELWWYH